MVQLTVCHTPYNIANAPYFYAYGLIKYHNVRSFLLIPFHVNSSEETILYGYKSLGNPYHVPILYYTSRRDLVRILASLAKEEIDILHLYGGGRLLHALYAKLIHAKIVRQFVGSDLREITWSRKLFFNLFKEHGIITGVPDAQCDLTWNRAWEKAIFIPLAVDPIFYEIPKADTDERIIFLPTRHDKIKRTMFAFKAWEILRELDKKARLIAIKWGDQCPYLLEKYKEDERISWMPLLPRQEYIKVLCRSSIVWGQFSGIGTGSTEREVMASKRPVLAYVKRKYLRLTGNPPIVQVSTPKALAYKTMELLDDKNLYERVVQKAFKWIKDTHDIVASTTTLYNYYKKILGTDKNER